MDRRTDLRERRAMSEATATVTPRAPIPLWLESRDSFQHPQDFDEAKIRLIVAAETLFAEQSIESVSLREIARAAANGNNNAVQYHFGSKAGLVQAVFAYRVWQMDPKRRKGMEALKAAGRDENIPELLKLLFLPMIDLTNEAGRHTYAGFVGRYLLFYRSAGLPHAADSQTASTSALRDIVSSMRDRLAHLPEDLVLRRIETTHLMFINTLVRSDNDGVSKNKGDLFRKRIADCIEMAAAAIAAPAPGFD